MADNYDYRASGEEEEYEGLMQNDFPTTTSVLNPTSLSQNQQHIQQDEGFIHFDME